MVNISISSFLLHSLGLVSQQCWALFELKKCKNNIDVKTYL